MHNEIPFLVQVLVMTVDNEEIIYQTYDNLKKRQTNVQLSNILFNFFFVSHF